MCRRLTHVIPEVLSHSFGLTHSASEELLKTVDDRPWGTGDRDSDVTACSAEVTHARTSGRVTLQRRGCEIPWPRHLSVESIVQYEYCYGI